MAAARRYLPSDPADLARSLVPLTLLAVAAAFPDVRLAVLVILGTGTAIAINRGAPVRWALGVGRQRGRRAQPVMVHVARAAVRRRRHRMHEPGLAGRDVARTGGTGRAGGPDRALLGPAFARPFFGDVGYEFAAGALVPALLFSLANGVMEEVIYRGALLGWSARVMGLAPAIVGQAVVFGRSTTDPTRIGLSVADNNCR